MLQVRVLAGGNQLIDTHSESEPMSFYLFPVKLLLLVLLLLLLSLLSLLLNSAVATVT